MTATGLEIVDLTEFVGDMEIPCDYAEVEGAGRWCPDQPARWVMHLTPCCVEGGGVRLACTPCKDARLVPGNSVECYSCGFVWERAAEAYRLIEPLERQA